MIYSAMLFALGAFVSGLVWLAIAVALVRRARRLTERRVMARVSTRRAEFETERDELRARHAVQMHRLEREVSRVLDMATAHRLEADLKERDLVSARAELAGREEDLREVQQRLTAERDLVQDLERRLADAGSTLRAVQHTLNLEANRRTLAQEALENATGLADRRRLELSGLRAQNETFRTMLGERTMLDEIETPTPSTPADSLVEQGAPPGGSVVPLPARRGFGPTPSEQSAALVTEAARDLQRLAGQGHGDFSKGVWRAPAHQDASKAEAGIVADLDARRVATPPVEARSAPAGEADADTRISAALAELRALKRAASQAGE